MAVSFSLIICSSMASCWALSRPFPSPRAPAITACPIAFLHRWSKLEREGGDSTLEWWRPFTSKTSRGHHLHAVDAWSLMDDPSSTIARLPSPQGGESHYHSHEPRPAALQVLLLDQTPSEFFWIFHGGPVFWHTRVWWKSSPFLSLLWRGWPATRLYRFYAYIHYIQLAMHPT